MDLLNFKFKLFLNKIENVDAHLPSNDAASIGRWRLVVLKRTVSSTNDAAKSP